MEDAVIGGRGKRMAEAGAKPARRRRGLQAGIDRTAIIKAAREIDPGEITMQRVADELGVDRKALNYHVSDRERLLELVASDVFDSHLAEIPLWSGDDWRGTCTRFAEAVRDSLGKTGELARHLAIPESVTHAWLRHAEIVLAALLDAGFDEETANRGLTALGHLCWGFGNDRLAYLRHGADPKIVDLRRVLDDPDAPDYPLIRRGLASGYASFSDSQFTMNLRLFLDGMERQLTEDHRQT